MKINSQFSNWTAQNISLEKSKYDSNVDCDRTSDYNDSLKNNKDDYFRYLCKKYPDTPINISNSYCFSNANPVTLNLSTKYFEKSFNDKEVSENIERLASLAESFPQYLSTHNTLPDGRQVKSVSFLVDENGGVSCTCEYKNSTSKETETVVDRLSNLIEKLEQRKEKQFEEKKSEYYNSMGYTYTKIKNNQSYYSTFGEAKPSHILRQLGFTVVS